MYFDWETKDYLRIPVIEQVEVATLIGDVAEDPSGKPSLHIHLVVGKRTGAARWTLSRRPRSLHSGSYCH
jgi:hypothetical protein